MRGSIVAMAVCAVALLAAAPAAQSKEVAKATVCGADGCAEVSDRALLRPMIEGGRPADPPARPGGWFRVTLTMGGDGQFHRNTIAALPAQRLIRTYDEASRRYSWLPIPARAARAFREAAAGLRPLPASRLRGLDQKPLEARVDEVVPPPRARSGEGSGSPLGLIALLAGAGVAGALALRAYPRLSARRSRRRVRTAE